MSRHGSRGRARAVTGRSDARPAPPNVRRYVEILALVLVLGLGVAAALAAVVVPGLGANANLAWSAPVPDPSTTVAVIHGEPVTWSDVAARLEAAEVMGQAAPANLEEWRRHVTRTIDSIIGDVLTRHYVEAQGTFVTPDRIDAEIARVATRYGGAEMLRRAMDEMHVTREEFRETQRRGLYTQALIDLVVPATDAQIDAYRARPGAAALTREEAAARVRAEHAAEVIEPLLADLRRAPGIQVIDITTLE